MSGTGILPHSAIAAANSDNKIRVYFQAYNGNLRESVTNDGENWQNGALLPAPVKPKTFTPLAATSWGADLAHIRVYYLDKDFVISELCWDGVEWYAGDLNAKKYIAASYSQLAVVHWADQLRVYYQESSGNTIRELVYSGGWTHGATLKEAAPASRLAANYTKDGQIHVYYQASNDLQNITRQSIWNKGWIGPQDIDPASNPPHGAYAAVSFGDSHLRLYFQKSDSKLYEVSGKGDATSWTGGVTSLGQFIPQTFLAAVDWGNISSIRVYAQTKGNTIQEVRWDKGKGWSHGAVLPTK